MTTGLIITILSVIISAMLNRQINETAKIKSYINNNLEPPLI